jgi:hypothetical protein
MAKKPEEGFHQLTDEVLKKLINDRVDGQTPITWRYRHHITSCNSCSLMWPTGNYRPET